MSISIHVLNSSGRLNAVQNDAKRIIRHTSQKVQKLLAIDNVDILVMEALYPEPLKNMGGIGGYSPSAHFVQITIDPDHKDVKKNLHTVLSQTIAHELCHVKRWEAGVMGKTLADNIVSEGLADYVVFTLTGNTSSVQKNAIFHVGQDTRLDFFLFNTTCRSIQILRLAN
ncbi:MAG: hypothetical protein HYV32_05945 [Candidatus Kerfeldbacteria bacterium]|nr:hypothetical protein [Candidatus Kerfeldbacteria bacterium]